MHMVLCGLAVLLVACAPAGANEAEYHDAMRKLATKSGCMSCHGVLPPPARADGMPPIAPAWRDVAIKYRDDPGASNRLTRTVMSGSNPGSRHWVGKVSDVTMPPNGAAVTEADARMLVNWILVLVP
jgi:cytochrome c